MTEVKRCPCGNGEIHMYHGVPSMRAFAVCPACFRQTDMNKDEESAAKAWNGGKTFIREEAPRQRPKG